MSIGTISNLLNRVMEASPQSTPKISLAERTAVSDEKEIQCEAYTNKYKSTAFTFIFHHGRRSP
jgi:hypothetical protein